MGDFDNFPERLKLVMKGESNYSFGEKCGVSEGTLRRYLRGDTYPPLDTLSRIAEVSGCSLAWLASGEEPGKEFDEALLQHIIIEVIKFQRQTDDPVMNMLAEVLAKQTASSIINTYKRSLGLSTPDADKIINEFNKMISSVTEQLNNINKG